MRGGETKEVKGWAVRIQFEGVRKTFSLKAQGRAAAAVEAKALYQMILSRGWDAAIEFHRTRRAPQPAPSPVENGSGKDDAKYWKQRLIQRKYTELLQSGSNRELSVRIGDEMTHYWFPLGTDAEAPAAARALEIYRTFESQGWESVCRKFPREITVAIFWSISPTAASYTTVYTLVEGQPEIPLPTPPAGEPRKNIAVIEPDPGIQRALAFWLNRQPDARCSVAAADLDAIFETPETHRPDLILFNRGMSQPAAGEVLQILKTRAPNLPVFSYAISEDIDQIFASLTGVKAGYIFRRRIPTELLEPIQGALRQKALSADLVARHVQTYFSNLFESGASAGPSPRIASLTARELEILNLLSKGCVDKEIADRLRISVWTVHSHLKKVYEKLQVHTRTEAVVRYLEK